VDTPSNGRQRLSFGLFEADLSSGELRRRGHRVHLQEQPFQLLSLLLERPGEVVTREEVRKKLWPDGTFVDFDEGLDTALKKLRYALRDSAQNPTFIETIPRRGYRFMMPVATNNERAIATSVDAGRAAQPHRLRFIATAAAVVAVAAVAVGLLSLFRPTPTPRVARLTQLTHSGRADPWAMLVSDGLRIYFLEREGDHWNLVQTSISGGESQIVPAPFRNTLLLDISPGRADFLIASFASRGTLMPLWIWPVQGGAPKRVGEITAYDAAWHPNERQIVYAKDDGIYLVDADGTNVRKFAGTDGRPGRFSRSSDGRLMRFSVFSRDFQSYAIWEVQSDGTQLRRLFPGWNDPPDECCGSSTPDRKFFFFQSKHSGTDDIWAIREQRSLFQRRQAEPARLTAGPVGFVGPLTSKDGRKLFVYGLSGKIELQGYNLKSRQFLPLLSGVCVHTVAYSPDGQWVACAPTQDPVLARMKPGGTQRLALTSPSIQAGAPRWSPDGKQISFEGLTKTKARKIFLVSIEGGTPKELFPDNRNQYDASWSSDGKFIAFARDENLSVPGSPSSAIQILNLSTNQLSLLPGSPGMRAPAWSPDGRFIAAVTEDLSKLMLFDLRTQQWTQLAEATLLNGGGMAWSKDGECLYYQDWLAANEPVYCLRLSDRKRELVTSFESFLRGGVHRVAFNGLAPDGSLILSLSRNNADIYSLDLDYR
jgi:DNA-binding winged helix-turn-helix (wHTH) protein/Tol biopolymer transport system component